MFAEMTGRLSTEVVRRLCKIQVQKQETVKKETSRQMRLQYNRGGEATHVQTVRSGKKVGRNDPCPCGSGKKFKKCCGVNG
jgi:preprotein translocase subunit SecA